MNSGPCRLDCGLNRDWLYIGGRISGRRLKHGRLPDAEKVNLPHSWNRLDTFQPGTSYRQGYGSYYKSFVIPTGLQTAGTRWIIISEGFYGTGDLWFNRFHAGGIDGQYIGFRRDVTGLMQPDGLNSMALRLDNRYHPGVLPGKRMPDFLLYGGLAGRVFLRRLPELHIDDERLFLTAEPDLQGAATLSLRCPVANESARARNARIRWSVMDADGRPRARREDCLPQLGPGQRHRLVCDQHLAPVRLWSPDDPYLYRIRVELLENDETLDCHEIKTGVRRAGFQAEKGFMLNGQRLPLRGANRHEYIPGFCNALPPMLHEADARLLKSLGFNFVRLAHYPQNPAFLHACDRLGLLVYAEIATWKSVRAGRWLKAAERQMRAMIERDRNHPGIILWGMGNESRSRKAYTQLHRLARDLDPSRETIYAENMLNKGIKAATLAIPDVVGMNYKLDRAPLARRHARRRVLLASETSNRPQARRGTEEVWRQIELIERDLGYIAETPYVAGYTLWSFNDYGTERKKRFRRYSGVVDAWRLPKMSAAWHLARCAVEPVISLFADWSETRPPGPRRVRIFTNCPEVELLVNGRRTMRLAGAGRLEVELPFEAGTLTATGYRGDQTVSDEVHSWGPAQGISIIPESLSATAEGGVLPVVLRVVDKQARTVADWEGMIEFKAGGAGIARGYRRDGLLEVCAGMARTFVCGSYASGKAQLEARHRQLRPATATVHFITSGQGKEPREL